MHQLIFWVSLLAWTVLALEPFYSSSPKKMLKLHFEYPPQLSINAMPKNPQPAHSSIANSMLQHHKSPRHNDWIATRSDPYERQDKDFGLGGLEGD